MSETSKSSGKKNKLAIAVLVVFSVVVAFFGIFSFKNDLAEPFMPRFVELENNYDICPDGNCPVVEEENSMLKDTDNDGLSDWDEINIHRTSPYLEDSDSDGINDLNELNMGMDPNCVGEQCGVGDIITDAKIEIESEEGVDLDMENYQFSKEDIMNMAEGEGGAEFLRQALLTAGMEKELLDQINDNDLMTAYYELIKEQ